VIEDLNSTNGIYVKSNRVRRHYLNDGDVVLLGKHELIYLDERSTRRDALGDTEPKLPELPEQSATAEPAAAAVDEDAAEGRPA